jgi:hypothetical protein
MAFDLTNFESGRHFAAWLELTLREHSTGGRRRLGKISKAGNERLRQLLVVGATAVIRYARPGSKSASGRLLQLLERKPREVAAVAPGQQDGPYLTGRASFRRFRGFPPASQNARRPFGFARSFAARTG